MRPVARKLARPGSAVVTALVAALVLAACGGGESGVVTLRMYDSTATKDGTEPIIAAFNASHPKIKMNVQYIPTVKLGQVETTQLQAGNPPDIIGPSPGSGGGSTGLSLYKLAKAGKLVDLSDRPWARDLPELLKPTATYEGKVYSLVGGLSTQFMDYTVPDMEKFGLKPPQDFAQLLALCKQAREHGTYAFVAGAADMAGNRMLLQSFAAANVYSQEPDWDAKRAAGKTTFQSTPGWHKVFQQVQDMINADCYYPGGAGRTTEEGKRMQVSGKSLMGIGPSTAATYLTARNPQRKWAAAPVPGGLGTALPLEVGGSSIPKDSKHIPEALVFLDYMAQHRDELARNTGAFSPAMMSRGELPDFLGPLEPLAKQGKFALGAGIMWPSEAPAQAAYKAMTGLYNGQVKVDDILRAMDDAWAANP
ncbi:ABC transporter substrate-binding protein [Pseudonocardia acaciae]|uniref:ABC transporter substrate-binding protein n=1 Tax=Pseudonocardia acaciae TaxID=551276 RepID=UPI0009FD00DE|nr:extracellular solute-binding protein [Pseudonocardia acaciae]